MVRLGLFATINSYHLMLRHRDSNSHESVELHQTGYLVPTELQLRVIGDYITCFSHLRPSDSKGHKHNTLEGVKRSLLLLIALQLKLLPIKMKLLKAVCRYQKIGTLANFTFMILATFP